MRLEKKEIEIGQNRIFVDLDPMLGDIKNAMVSVAPCTYAIVPS